VLACGFSLLMLGWLWLVLPLLLHIGMWLGRVSPDRLRALAKRRAAWHFFGWYAPSVTGTTGSSAWSSGSSWSGDSLFSGGGGSFGGGGSSGSW